MTSHEIDALIAEKLFGLNLKPSREMAMAKVAWRHICGTGSMFSLRDGSLVHVPAKTELPLVEGLEWNDHYALYVAQQRATEWAQEFDDYRLTPEPYSSDLVAAFLVIEKMRTLGWGFICDDQYPGNDTDPGYWWVEFEKGGSEEGDQAHGASFPAVVCAAALKALGVTVES